MRDLILLHGALETSATMSPLAELLQVHFRCHNLSFSGHAPTQPLPSEFRIQTFVEELDEYLKSHQLENVTVVGHSMGGYVALSHCAHVEDSPITRVVCYGTKFEWGAATLTSMLAQLHPENEALMAHLKKVFGDNATRLLAATTHMMAHLERLDGLTPADLGDISATVELVVGDKDKVVTMEETQQVAHCLPHGHLH
jgi:pimeloyl-ACP methyl ester carboxylesterase